jgi:hypothetical protein
MPHLIKAALAAALLLTALPNPAAAWYCKAVARDNHYGWASYFNRHEAIRVAMANCAERSSIPETCRIVTCYPD